MSNIDDIINELDGDRRRGIARRAAQLIEDEYQRQISELIGQRAVLSLKLQMVARAWDHTPVDFKSDVLDQYPELHEALQQSKRK